ncbi:MAG: NADH-quinone oxidoreductase subunit M, partial [Chloroflexota bacterium]
GFTSLGLPGFSGFIAEFLVFAGLFQNHPWFGALAVLGAAITAAYILRLLATVFFGPLQQRWAGLHDASRVETLALAVLAAVLVAVGVAPSLLLPAIDSGVAPLMARVLQGA